jgi:hypothetical protein
VNAATSCYPLIAERSRVDALGGTFRTRSESGDYDQVLTGLFILAAIFVGIWLLSRLLAMRDRHRVYNSPRRLFRSLCKAQGLGWRDRRLLRRLAGSQQLKDPGRLFLEAERFDEAKLPPSLRPNARRLREIRDCLFVELLEKKSAEPSVPREQSAGKTEGTPVKPGPRQREAKRRPAATPPLAPPPASPVLDIPPWTTGSEATVG